MKTIFNNTIRLAIEICIAALYFTIAFAGTRLYQEKNITQDYNAGEPVTLCSRHDSACSKCVASILTLKKLIADLSVTFPMMVVDLFRFLARQPCLTQRLLN